jgi:hypothetical protein
VVARVARSHGGNGRTPAHRALRCTDPDFLRTPATASHRTSAETHRARAPCSFGPCLVFKNISFINFSFRCAKGFHEARAKFLSAAVAKCVSGSCTKPTLPLFNAMQSTNKSMHHPDKQNRRVPRNHLFKSSNTLKGK